MGRHLANRNETRVPGTTTNTCCCSRYSFTDSKRLCVVSSEYVDRTLRVVCSAYTRRTYSMVTVSGLIYAASLCRRIISSISAAGPTNVTQLLSQRCSPSHVSACSLQWRRGAGVGDVLPTNTTKIFFKQSSCKVRAFSGKYLLSPKVD